MTAYLIAVLEVLDPERFAQYAQGTPDVVAKYGGTYVARGGTIDHREGVGSPDRAVIIRFESMETARRYYESPEYTALRALRAGAATGTLLFTEGLP